jgi:predicted  nucleic acid-binding Zn-ribbon protein
MAVDKIILELQADVKGFKAELGNVRKELDSTQKKVSDTGKNATQSFNQVGTSLKGLAATIGVAFGVQQIVQFGKASVNAYIEAEKNAKLLLFALNGNVQVQQRLIEQSARIQKTTIYSDDQVQQAQTFLANQEMNEQQIMKTIDAATLLATVTGVDLQTATEQLSGTYEGSIGRLGKLDSRFKDLTKEQLANGGAIDIIIEKYKGLDIAAGETTEGQLKRFQNALGDIQEEIGMALTPTINDLIKSLSEFAKETDFNEVMAELGDIFNTIWQPIGDVLSAFDNLFEAITGTSKAGDKLISFLDGIGVVVKLIAIPFKIISEILVEIINRITKAVDIFKSLREEGGVLGTVLNAIASAFSFLGSEISEILDLQDNEIKKLRDTKTASNELVDAFDQRIKKTKEDKKETKEQASAFELLNKQLDTAKKLLLDNITTGKDYYAQERKIYELTQQLEKIQAEYNATISGGIKIQEEQLVPLESTISFLEDKGVPAWEKYGAAIEASLKKQTLGDPGQDPTVKRIESIVNTAQGIGQVSSSLADLFTTIGDAAAQQGQKNAAFQKSLAIFAIQLKLAESIANVIANITANSKDPLTLATNIISGVAAITTAISQTTAIINRAEVPQYADGTAFVGLNGNPKGIDTIPAYLNEGEAVIPTDMNNKYPGLASSWIKGNLDEYIMSNWVAPAIEQQRNKDLANNIAEALKINGMFDDYRLYRSLEKNSSINQSGFHSLAKAINKNNKKRGGYA